MEVFVIRGGGVMNVDHRNIAFLLPGLTNRYGAGGVIESPLTECEVHYSHDRELA
jgi:hypothetical protein